MGLAVADGLKVTGETERPLLLTTLPDLPYFLH
ncbi:hypothetical protein BH09BAC3_BH09BAC3_03180 [soil metagenome]